MNKFTKKIGDDGRLYIPNYIGARMNLKDKVVKLSCKSEDFSDTVYSKVAYRYRERSNTEEYRVGCGKKFSNKEAEITIINSFEPNPKVEGVVGTVLENFEHLYIEDEEDIILMSSKNTTQVDKNLEFDNFLHYLGAFFADGLKKSYSWGISASTFEQAKYYIKKHNQIVDNNELVFRLTYTHYGEIEEDELKRIEEAWKDNAGIEIDNTDTNESDVETALNRNEYGSVYMREHKQLLGEFYNELLDFVCRKIINGEYDALPFVLGMLEGDGSTCSTKRAHIEQTVARSKIDTVEKIYKQAGFKTALQEREDDNYIVRIGSIELLERFDKIGDELFKYYPKRRNKAIDRLVDTGTAKYILGEGEENIVGEPHREMYNAGIIDRNSNLTKKGEVVKEKLENARESVTVS